MSLKDRFDKFIDYFTETGTDIIESNGGDGSTKSHASSSSTVLQQSIDEKQNSAISSTTSAYVDDRTANENITRLHARQQELAQKNYTSDNGKITIEVRYPRKYEEATQIVNHLVANESILIDFQHMAENQARRCLDYLDGARYVLAGNLKRVSGTMYLLTPINVIVNVEDINLPGDTKNFNFDMNIGKKCTVY